MYIPYILKISTNIVEEKDYCGVLGKHAESQRRRRILAVAFDCPLQGQNTSTFLKILHELQHPGGNGTIITPVLERMREGVRHTFIYYGRE